MQRKNNILDAIGGCTVVGLIAAYFMRKLEKRNEETDRRIRESRDRILKLNEEFFSELVSYEEEKEEALKPFGEYLDDLEKMFVDEESEH